mmetsp:Transcript_78311/g.151217  ORF Transcript_78311/g.151217 Transcript_78311/m.151217 type:complete len:205 (-) Transcript_78311:1486-2100(-)
MVATGETTCILSSGARGVLLGDKVTPRSIPCTFWWCAVLHELHAILATCFAQFANRSKVADASCSACCCQCNLCWTMRLVVEKVWRGTHGCDDMDRLQAVGVKREVFGRNANKASCGHYSADIVLNNVRDYMNATGQSVTWAMLGLTATCANLLLHDARCIDDECVGRVSHCRGIQSHPKPCVSWARYGDGRLATLRLFLGHVA